MSGVSHFKQHKFCALLMIINLSMISVFPGGVIDIYSCVLTCSVLFNVDCNVSGNIWESKPVLSKLQML